MVSFAAGTVSFATGVVVSSATGTVSLDTGDVSLEIMVVSSDTVVFDGTVSAAGVSDTVVLSAEASDAPLSAEGSACKFTNSLNLVFKFITYLTQEMISFPLLY